MATIPNDDEPGFEAGVNALPEGDEGSEDTSDGKSRSEDGDAAILEDAQKEGARERTEGGYH